MATDGERPTAQEEPERPQARVGRRGFLKGVGASALATAAVVFGTARAAEARYPVACCNLWNPPTSWSNCASKPDRYIWTCHVHESASCDRPYQCCEAGAKPSGGWTWSAYRRIAGCV